MTDIQKILKAVSSHTITADTYNRLIRALDTIPEYHHADFLLAFFHDEPEPEPEAQPEDYLAVKTFNSGTFHVGDEVIVDGYPCVIYELTDIGTAEVFSCGPAISFNLESKYVHRTGRNFPAIPAILEELKKALTNRR